MLKIGEFAKACGVNVQTLRYYDQIGVFCADHIDPDSGYRYYSRDKLKTFALIEQLKQLDFSLDEIKQFLACSPTEQCRIYRNKKQAILEGIHQKNHQVGQIDEFCGNTQPGVLPLTQQILQMPFEHDPRVIGKWMYCGDMKPEQAFDNEDTLIREDVLLEHIYFLPGGSHVWMYFWSKGFLYYTMPYFNVIVPNAYRIFTVKETTYMEIDWMVDIFAKGEQERKVLIYKQVDTKEYTERETRIGRDNVDIPYVADQRVLGDWETVDLVHTPDQFDSQRKYWESELMIVDMQFYPRGICQQTRRLNGGMYQKGLRYSAGVVLDVAMEFAQHYRIFTERGQDYLIMEHKSGDYSYGGVINGYYIFRRKTK